ncbi:hypothetical protein M8C21_004681 [Ambrosia artemisiifolia]|uniref:Cytochrome P450 n=1 Tax=Ambrosia artemisiifolia TaxID=4212 RepID=A0AAD5CTE7_AMBAR|nr:hypothetical protein M8C21_004681 [Ambrosia artemisiifolia]
MISEVAYEIYHTIITFWSWWWEVQNEQDELARAILTISVMILLLVCYQWKQSYSRNCTTPLPPGPYGLPVVGYLPFIGSNLHERFTKLAKTYGPIFSLRLGSKLHVVVNSMDLVKVVAHDMDQTFANRSPPLTALIMSYGGLDIVFSNNNAHWRNMRKVDMNEIAFNTSLNVVTSMLWGRSKSPEGKDSGYLGDRFREIEFKIVELLGAPNISDYFPMLKWFDLQRRQRDMQGLVEYVDRIFESIIEKRIKINSSAMDEVVEEDGRKDILQILLELTRDQKDAPTQSNGIHIKAFLLDLIIAATDTTSTVVEWVMAEILNNQGVMRKVQDELTYVIVGSYNIPKGTIVFMNIWAIQRDPKNWTNPLEFKPERFLKGNWDYKGNSLKFLPFGIGRRICAGIPLAEKMSMYIVASLLHSFDWMLPKDEDFELSDKFGIVTKKKKPLIAIPSQRLSDSNLFV